MKKLILFFPVFVFMMNAVSQVSEMYPANFNRAISPGDKKNKSVNIPLPVSSSSAVSGSTNIDKNMLLRSPSQITESIIGNTFYDHQYYGSSNNLIFQNSDGTISTSWNFSPNAIQTTTPPFPSRGAGYNYWNGTNWLYPAGPTSSPGPLRTGYPNIVVTPSGKEMIISHAHNPLASFNAPDSNFITITWRAVKGTANWDTVFQPWGMVLCHSMPKACSGLTNEKVYVIFLGKNGNTINQEPPSTKEASYGPILFSRSLNSGLTWDPPVLIPLIDASNYQGFSGGAYSIMARGDTVAISYGNTFTDIGLLKSTDAGQTWTKTIVQLHPHPRYNINADSISDFNQDGIADTILSNSGDSKVLIDNEGMCHVWFSAFSYVNDTTGDSLYTGFYTTDNLYYWNETMPQNNGYVAIAATQDFNGNGVINYPPNPTTSCDSLFPFGFYGGGLTEKPSAGIDASGRIYLAYQALNEEADITNFNALHKHIFMMTLDKTGGVYQSGNWTYPYSIVPGMAVGGYGEFQEAVFASVTPIVAGSKVNVLYQRDDAPGHSFDTCFNQHNLGNSSDIVIASIDAIVVSTKSIAGNEISINNIFPNPSESVTSISIGLKKSDELSIDIFDITGRIVMHESVGKVGPATMDIPFNVSGLVPGIYTCTISSGGERSARKLLISRQ